MSWPYQILINTPCSLAEFDNHDDMLPNSEEQFGATSCSGASPTLGDGCIISDDCSTITCKMDFVDKPITFTLKVLIAGYGHGIEVSSRILS